jgi:hypothetical protein
VTHFKSHKRGRMQVGSKRGRCVENCYWQAELRGATFDFWPRPTPGQPPWRVTERRSRLAMQRPDIEERGMTSNVLRLRFWRFAAWL